MTGMATEQMMALVRVDDPRSSSSCTAPAQLLHMAVCGTPHQHFRLCAVPAFPVCLQLTDLPSEVLQSIMDLLSTFVDRARMYAACKASRSLEWRLAAPLRLDEELSNMRLGDVGALAVASALSTPANATLGELCLGGNHIGNAGARAIALALVTGPLVRRLSLRDNDIGDSGAG